MNASVCTGLNHPTKGMSVQLTVAFDTNIKSFFFSETADTRSPFLADTRWYAVDLCTCSYMKLFLWKLALLEPKQEDNQLKSPPSSAACGQTLYLLMGSVSRALEFLKTGSICHLVYVSI